MKRRAPAFNVLLAGARHRLTPLFSNYCFGSGGREGQRQKETQLPPSVPGCRAQGSQREAGC